MSNLNESYFNGSCPFKSPKYSSYNCCECSSIKHKSDDRKKCSAMASGIQVRAENKYEETDNNVPSISYIFAYFISKIFWH